VGVFTGLLTTNGMGSWSNLTMFYAMQHLSFGKLYCDFVSPSCQLAVKGGCEQYYLGVSAYLGNAVHVNATIIDVVRPLLPFGKTIINAIVNNRLKVFFVDKLVVAIPETLSNLKFLDLDLRERAAFADVTTKNYWVFEAAVTGAITEPSGTSNGFTVFSVDVLAADGQPPQPCMLGINRALPYGPVNGWAGSNYYISDSAMKNITAQNLAILASINTTLISSASLAPASDPVFIRHVFSPFFPASSLAKSPTPFSVIANLQGHRNTYYIGALLSIPDSSKVWEFAYQIVNHYF